MMGRETYRVRVYELATKRCLTEARGYAEGEAASVMTVVWAKNGAGFIALITPEKSVA